MTESPVTKLILSLSVPAVISTLITTIYNMADTFFVAKLGNSAVGAVGIVFSIQTIIQAFGFGISMGCSSLISRRLGEKDNKAANVYASSGLFAAILVGIILMMAGMVDLNGVMRLFGSTETILPYARSYGLIILFGAPVMCPTFVLSNVLRSEGKASFTMVGVGVGGLLNILLDPILIYTFGLGISGAAIATVLSQCISFLVLLWFFISGRSIITLSPRYISRKIRDYFIIIKTGFPTVCRQGLASLSTTLLNIAVRPYGDAAVAAISIANKIYMLLRNIVLGVGQGFQPVAGYNYGAGKHKRVRKAFWIATAIGSIFSVASGIMIIFFGDSLMSLFRKGDIEVIRIGSIMLRYLGFALPFMAYSTYVNQMYQSLGFVFGATFLASCRQGLFFIPLILILPQLAGITGIQMTQSAADILTFMASVPFQIWFFKKKLTGKTEKRVFIADGDL